MMRPVPADLDPSERDAFERAQTVSCPAPETLLPAMEGTLPEPLRGRILSHMEHCAVCRMLAEAQASPECSEPTVEESKRIQSRVKNAGRTSRAWWRPVAAAAVITIAVGAGWLAQFDRQDSVMPSAPGVPVGASPRAGSAFVLTLEKPEVELPPGALVLRSRGADPYATALSGALAPFRRDDYPGAIQKLAALQSSHPNEPFVSYYLGVSYLLAGQAADAVAPLERARTDGTANTWLRLDASWYLAVALERVGRRDAAAIVLTEICGTGESRREQACAALGTLLAPRIGWRLPSGRVTTPMLADARALDGRSRRGASRPVD